MKLNNIVHREEITVDVVSFFVSQDKAGPVIVVECFS
jgi:hypothetical protein